MSIEITWMLIWSNTNTRHVLVKQLKVKKKERIKSRIIITIISFSRKVYKITTLFWYWSWLDWRQLYDKGTWNFQKSTPWTYSRSNQWGLVTFMFQLAVKIKVKLNLSQMPLSRSNSNMTKIVDIWVVYLLLLKCQLICCLKFNRSTHLWLVKWCSTW